MARGSAYTTAEWHEFFVASAGAAAALTGLVFVALSINLQQILSMPWLPARAGETIVLLFEALTVSLLCLVPQQRVGLGWQLVATGFAGWLFVLVLQMRGRTQMKTRGKVEYLGRVTVTQISTLPIIAAGVSLVAGHGGGLYWLVPGLVFLLLVGIVNAWVLLVEIIR